MFGSSPWFDKFDPIAKLLIQPGNLLEIGSGTGHLLAAAQRRGFTVSGIELSPYHRNFVRQTWGIDLLEKPLEELDLPADKFDNVISINVFEHLPDPKLHLSSVRRVLKPGGRYFISTSNANALVAKICGGYWSMFKPPDHLSIPSTTGMRSAADAAGLSTLRVWSTDLPLETPLGLAVALRDWKHERRGVSKNDPVLAPDVITNRAGRALLMARPFKPIAAVFGWMNLGGSLKALLEKPAKSRAG
jgi:SAM-dependent methyltransferase